MTRELTSPCEKGIGRGAFIYGIVLVACLATRAAAADPPTSGPPGKDWLELAVGEYEQALFRHHFRANLLSQIQALVGNKPAEGTKLLDVMDGALVVRRGGRMWLDLSRVEKGQADELRRLAAVKDPADRLDLMTELREHVAKVYYERLAPYKSLAEFQRAHPYRDNPEYLAVPVDSDFLATRRVIYIAKDRVADALASYADHGDRVLYPPQTAIIAEALDEQGEVRDVEVLWKRPDGYWTALIFDHAGRLVHDATVERGKGKSPMNFTASFNCFACHRVTREDTSEALRDNGFNYLDQLSQRMNAPWPEQVHLGPEYRERAAYQLTETELRERDGVFGPYGSLLLSELIYKQQHDSLGEADRRRYERLQPQFPLQLPPLEN